MTYYIDTDSLYLSSTQLDTFDLVILQNDYRGALSFLENKRFKKMMKAHNKILKQYKKEQIEIKENINNFVINLLEDENYNIRKKRDLLIDSFYDVINDDNKISELKDMTDDIFMSKPDARIDIIMEQRQKLIAEHLYYVRNITAGNDECLICKDQINQIFLKKCKYCIATYHKSCIDKWLELNDKCPMCKQIY